MILIHFIFTIKHSINYQDFAFGMEWDIIGNTVRFPNFGVLDVFIKMSKNLFITCYQVY